MEIHDEDVLERMFACQHRMVVDMANIAASEEWSPLEILAMRVFARNPMALGARDLTRILGCSLPHASRLTTSLRERGLIYQHRWKNFRSLMMTDKGHRWLARELPNLTEFACEFLLPLTATERRALHVLHSRLMREDENRWFRGPEAPEAPEVPQATSARYAAVTSAKRCESE